MLKTIVVSLALGTVVAAQVPQVAFDPADLARLKDFTAERVSSNNPDPESNDDSLSLTRARAHQASRLRSS